MLRRFTKRNVDPQVKLLPMVVDTLMSTGPMIEFPVIDYQQAFNKDFVSLPSRQGFWKRMKGTMGLNIDEKAYN